MSSILHTRLDHLVVEFVRVSQIGLQAQLLYNPVFLLEVVRAALIIFALLQNAQVFSAFELPALFVHPTRQHILDVSRLGTPFSHSVYIYIYLSI